MLQERPDEIPDWKSRLAELDALPGELSMNNAGWEKLSMRLHKKKKTGIPYWYWMAAACMIFILVILFNPFKTNNTGIVQQHKEQMPAIITLSPPVIKETNTETRPLVANIKNTPIISPRSIKKTHKTIPHTITATPPLTLPKEDEHLTTATLIDTPSISMNLPALVAPMKKLRVIHINEINHPVGEKEVLVRNIDASNRDRFIRTHPTNNYSDNIFKIKLSPSN